LPLFHRGIGCLVHHFIAKQLRDDDADDPAGLTLACDATVRLLNMNHQRRVELRQQWLGEGGTF